MSSIQEYESNKPALRERRRYAWEDEETLVDQRKKLHNRIRIFFADNWGKLLILSFILVTLLDAEVMRSIVSLVSAALPYMANFLLLAFIIIGQFVMMFWFLGRTRTYMIWPGSDTQGVSFADYRGQPELLEQAKQIVTLLRGVRAFEQAGGEPLNGLLLEGPPGTGKTWSGAGHQHRGRGALLLY